MKRPVNELFESSLENVKTFMDTSKIIGNPLKVDENTTIIPIAKITLGFGIGGSEFKNKDDSKKKNKDELLFELSEEKLFEQLDKKLDELKVFEEKLGKVMQ